MLTERLKQCVQRIKRSNKTGALLFLDIDNFKRINDSLGHVAGDELLIEVANRLTSVVRESDTLARIGGDEFVLLLGDFQLSTQCERMLTRLIDSLSQPYHIDKQSIIIGASIGVSLYPTDDNDFDNLMKHADVAMYEAKEAGRNCYRIFNSEEN